MSVSGAALRRALEQRQLRELERRRRIEEGRCRVAMVFDAARHKHKAELAKQAAKEKAIRDAEIAEAERQEAKRRLSVYRLVEQGLYRDPKKGFITVDGCQATDEMLEVYEQNPAFALRPAAPFEQIDQEPQVAMVSSAARRKQWEMVARQMAEEQAAQDAEEPEEARLERIAQLVAQGLYRDPAKGWITVDGLQATGEMLEIHEQVSGI